MLREKYILKKSEKKVNAHSKREQREDINSICEYAEDTPNFLWKSSLIVRTRASVCVVRDNVQSQNPHQEKRLKRLIDVLELVDLGWWARFGVAL